MKIEKSPSFCGRIVNKPKVEGIEHLCTPTVRKAVRKASGWTVLRFKDGYYKNWCRVEFSIPTSEKKSLIYGPKKILTEKDILALIAKGVRRLKKKKKK